MAYDIDQELAAFGSDTVTMKLVRGVWRAVPFAPTLPGYTSLEEAIAHYGDATPGALAAARVAVRHDTALGVLWMGSALDTAGSGLAVVTGVTTAVGAYKNNGRSLETDSQQAADAVLKALGIAYMTWKLFDGTPTERAQQLLDTDAGRAMVLYLAAVEVGLPS